MPVGHNVDTGACNVIICYTIVMLCLSVTAEPPYPTKFSIEEAAVNRKDAVSLGSKSNGSLTDLQGQHLPSAKREVVAAWYTGGGGGLGLDTVRLVPPARRSQRRHHGISSLTKQEKAEGKVTLMQVEKECEASMRKQFQENQPQKKLQLEIFAKSPPLVEGYRRVNSLSLVVPRVREGRQTISRGNGICKPFADGKGKYISFRLNEVNNKTNIHRRDESNSVDERRLKSVNALIQKMNNYRAQNSSLTREDESSLQRVKYNPQLPSSYKIMTKEAELSIEPKFFEANRTQNFEVLTNALFKILKDMSTNGQTVSTDILRN